MSVARYIADFVANLAVSNVFILSGTGSIHLDDAFHNHPSIGCVNALHEAAAVLMAEAAAKVTGRPGVVVVTTGPGGINAIGGVAEAWVDSVPVLVISGQVERRYIDDGARSFGIQGFKVIDAVRGMTKYAAVVDDPATIRYHLERAVHEATTGRPGPVWLDVPVDIQPLAVAADHLVGFAPPIPAPARPLGDAPEGRSPLDADLLRAVDRISDLLSRSRRPLVVAGQGIRQGGAIHGLRDLIEHLGIPVVAARLGQDMLPFGFPLYLGLGGVRGRPAAAAAMREADLVLSLGSSLAHALVGQDFSGVAADARVAMVDIDRAELIRHQARLDLAVRYDVGRVMAALIDRVGPADLAIEADWVEHCTRLKRELNTVQPKHRVTPINSYYLFNRLDANTTSRHWLVTDTGSAYYVAGQALQFDQGQRELTSGAFANMGVALPLAIGASVSDPGAQVVAVIGDGSIELHIQELKTISTYGLDVKVFVINNGGYASIRDAQDAACDGRYTEREDVLNFEKVAAAFDMPFLRIERHEEIDDRITELLDRRGPHLVEVMCDHDQEVIGATAPV